MGAEATLLAVKQEAVPRSQGRQVASGASSAFSGALEMQPPAIPSSSCKNAALRTHFELHPPEP